MDDNNIGNIIVYLILAIIAIIGSVNKGKKTIAGQPKQKRPGSFFDIPSVGNTSAPVFKEEQKSQPVKPAEKAGPVFTFNAEDEGRYGEPYSGQYGDEGERYDPLADLYKDEGSKTDIFAEKYSSEGRMEDRLASAFAGEGVSGLSSAKIKDEDKNAIAENEIGDAISNDDISGENDYGKFNLRKAVVYSAILERKEYAF